MNRKTITIKVQKNYGVEYAYPVCTEAKLFCEIARTKTLSYEAIANIKKLGYGIKIEVMGSSFGKIG